MDILVVEDNDIKFDLVEGVLRSVIAAETIVIRRASSYQSGVSALVNGRYHCVVLDMTLPVYDQVHAVVAAEELTFGGELVLREVARRQLPARFIVLSQYDKFWRNGVEVTFGQLRLELMRKYPSVLGCVRLDSSSVEWKDQIATFINTP